MTYVSGLVSVIIPVYNRKELVPATIDSVLAQTYENFEIILVNDGSTDDSGVVLDTYAARFPEKIKVVHQENTGQVVARNHGINASSGEFIAFLDSDDTWLPLKLEKQLPKFLEGVGLVYSGIYEVDKSGAVSKTVLPEDNMRGNIYYDLLVKNCMTGGSVVVTREALNHVGLFDTALRAAENWDLWIRISQRYTVDFVPEPLVRYLKHEGNMSGDSSLMNEATKIIYEKHIPEQSNDQRIQDARRQAYAFLHYLNGILAFGSQRYKDARNEFKLCWKYIPNYKDTQQRYYRTFLGGYGNLFLSKIGKVINKP